VVVCLLVDASITPQQVDLDYALWLHRSKVPFVVVFTKVGSRGQDAQQRNLMQLMMVFKPLPAAPSLLE
jgi:GTP-binding protein EngB required for normal cell division